MRVFIAASGLFHRLLWVALAVCLASPAWAGGPSAPVPNGPAASLAQALAPDGTLRPGTSGAFNAAGYRMALAPDGKPVFRPAAALGVGDDKWQDGFGLLGANGPVFSIVLSGADLYVGGEFSLVGKVAASGIAKWNGTAWSALGAGVRGSVYALVLVGTDVYVGGNFSQAGGAPAQNVA